ncbi:universal stress protein [Gynuella sp.]|uniref:universal stress protein n=1 Tax=Gynuella sp. TaxID=2969146 RepID=UPI003D0D12D3
MYKKVLAPVDLKENGYSPEIAKTALALARAEDAEIYLVSVLNGVSSASSEFEQFEEKLMAFAEQHMGVDERVSLHVLLGNASEEILKFAKAKACDLIIIANHKQTTNMLGNPGFGTITAKVAVQAACSVLIVKASG